MSARPRNAWSRDLIRMTAVLCLSVIGLDLATDAGCDPIALGGARAAVMTADAHQDGDACAPVCVPDCFCCSLSAGVATSPLPASLAPALPVAAYPSTSVSAGVHPVPYHPPLQLS